jgi:DNA-binding CsgD family transcriptional regulator/tetratricopeptide (TPR) repeat protein
VITRKQSASHLRDSKETDLVSPNSPLAAPAPLCALSLYAGRSGGSIVGRPLELEAVEQELSAAESGMAVVTLEGEPGIGKTRLLLAIDEMARQRGYRSIAVTTDEEIRGPLLLARSIFAATDVAADDDRGREAMRRAADAIAGLDPDVASLPADQRMFRIFDLASAALRTLAVERPLALLVDDLQWADEDSIRMLRYLVRTSSGSRLFMAFTVRGEEIAFVDQAVTLFADLERLGVLRRLRLARFTQVQSTEFLRQTLGGPINLATAATMHAQAEGVPFVLGEQLRAYREAGLIQQIEGVWTLARNAERLLPSAVKTLIQRRLSRLPEETRTLLAEAAVLGRAFSLRDLHQVKSILGDPPRDSAELEESLDHAVAAGFLLRQPGSSAADFVFSHGQIREFASSSLSPQRRRSIDAAIIEMLTDGQDPPPESLAMLAQHALAAGQNELCARFALEAAALALKSNSPEEAIRLVDMAHSVATVAADRVKLLRLRDDALNMLRRPAQRLEGLAELAALTQALGDSRLEMEVSLRRAAAFRLSRDHQRAAEIARAVREAAAERGDRQTELAAWLELGQDLLRADLGEGYAQTPLEADIEGAAAAYEAAAGLARDLGDERSLAAATRELGIIAVSRVRAWFVAWTMSGEIAELERRVASGEKLDQILPTLPIAPQVMQAGRYFTEALELYERLGDRQGAMSTIIAIAFISWGPQIHLGGSAKRIEELRRLSTRMKSLTSESDRELADAQMLFGSHVYSRAKVFPDVAIAKGQEAYEAARALGDTSLEFAAAGGTAMAYAEIGDVDSAERWLARAGDIAASEPTPHRAWQLLVWRGTVRAVAGDAAAMRELLQRAVQVAMDQGRAAARCETLALLASEASRLGRERGDEELLSLAQTSAAQAKELALLLPGRPMWPGIANAALARVATARGVPQEALPDARTALSNLADAHREDAFLEIILPCAEVIIAAGDDNEAAAIRDRLRTTLTMISAHIVDETVRAAWFRTWRGRGLTSLAAVDPGAPRSAAADEKGSLAADEIALLGYLGQGMTNSEIAVAMGLPEDSVNRALTEIYSKIGASSRADATTAALLGGLI